jgi:hypothetical protein
VVAGSSEAAAMVVWSKAAPNGNGWKDYGTGAGSSDGGWTFLQIQSDQKLAKPPPDHRWKEPLENREPAIEYYCARCLNKFYKSEIFINLPDPSMDWRGSLNLICRDCWNVIQEDDWREQCSKKIWKKKCQAQWDLRKTNSGEHLVMRVRCASFMQAKLDIGRMHKGESKQEFRERLIQATRKFASAITAGRKKLRDDQQAKVDQVVSKWVVEWEQKAENPEYITKLDCEILTSTHHMDFVDQILPGIDEYYMCRHKECSMVCRASEWVNNLPNYQYRCPACGEIYRPWMSKPGYWPTNKVIFTYDEVNLQSGKAVLAAGSSEGPVGKNTVSIFPVIWPDTATDLMKDRIKAIFLDLDKDILALEPKDRLGFVLENMGATAPHQAFEFFEFTPSTMAIIDNLNAGQKSTKPKWNYEHLVKSKGFSGLKLGEGFGLDEPMAHEDYLRVWGLSMWLEDCAAKSVLVSH